MARRKLTNNQVAAIIGTVAGILMIIAGFSGASRLDMILDFVRRTVGSEAWINIISYILISLASLGGVLVILGSVLFTSNRVFAGKVFIWLGTGFGIVSFIFFLIIQSERIDTALAGGAGLKLAGVVLAIIAQMKAKAVPKRR